MKKESVVNFRTLSIYLMYSSFAAPRRVDAIQLLVSLVTNGLVTAIVISISF